MTDEQKKDLLEYLKNAIALESDLIKQQNISDDFQSKVLSLKPVYHRLRYPNKPQLTETNIGPEVAISVFYLSLAILCIAATLVTGGIGSILAIGCGIYFGYHGVPVLMATTNDISIKKREEKE